MADIRRIYDGIVVPILNRISSLYGVRLIKITKVSIIMKHLKNVSSEITHYKQREWEIFFLECEYLVDVIVPISISNVLGC